MFRRMRSRISRLIRIFICGLPSDSLNSSLMSWRLMRMSFAYRRFCLTRSIAPNNMNRPAPLHSSAVKEVPTSCAPVSTPASGKTKNSANRSRQITYTAAPNKGSSTMAWIRAGKFWRGNSRRRARGLSRLKSGATLLTLNPNRDTSICAATVITRSALPAMTRGINRRNSKSPVIRTKSGI